MLGILTAAQIEEVLHSEKVARIGCHAGGRTYVVPFCYAYDGGSAYGHTAEGMKTRMMREEPRVCLEVERIEDLANWRSVIAWGRYEELTGPEAERGFLLLLDRFLPLLAGETVVPPHGDPAAAHRRDAGGRPTVVFRIRLGEKSGRFETVARARRP